MEEGLARKADNPRSVDAIARALEAEPFPGSEDLLRELRATGRNPVAVRLTVSRPPDPRGKLTADREAGHLRQPGTYPDVNRAEFGEMAMRAGGDWAMAVQAFDRLAVQARRRPEETSYGMETCSWSDYRRCRQRPSWRHRIRDEHGGGRVNHHALLSVDWLLGLSDDYLWDSDVSATMVRRVIERLRQEREPA